ncbi:MAG: hypothetical protein H0V44_10570 [Planctomycetes bacterium]|nr:hypothetical protein [Planctomycetota bacterium]
MNRRTIAPALLVIALALPGFGVEGDTPDNAPATEATAPAPAAPEEAPVTEPSPVAARRAARAKRERAPRVEESVRMRILDIRLAVGGTPGPSRVRDDYEAGSGSSLPTGGYDYGLKKQGGGFLQVGFMSGKLRDHGGLIWGVGLRSSGYRIDVEATPTIDRTQDLSYSTFGPIATIGYGYAFGEHFHVEAGPYLSVGAARADWFDRDATSTYREATADGAFAQAGVRLGGYFTIVRHLVLGLGLEYGSSIAVLEADHSASSGKSKLTVRTHGLGAGLEVGFRF